jgi:uncharacterized beta-barrel protein YwiB (DUF1934 family)
MESKKVKIGISAKQMDDMAAKTEEPVVMNVLCEAMITDDGDNIIIEYEEFLVDGGGVTQTKLIFSKNASHAVSLMRTGLVEMACTFAKGERFNCAYRMSDGIGLDFCMVTKDLKNTLSYEGGSLFISYTVEVRGLVVSRNEYRLNIIKR